MIKITMKNSDGTCEVSASLQKDSFDSDVSEMITKMLPKQLSKSFVMTVEYKKPFTSQDLDKKTQELLNSIRVSKGQSEYKKAGLSLVRS